MAKLALITGGGSGIGKALAVALCRKGYECIIVGRRPEKLDEVCHLVGGQLITPVPADITTADGRTAVQAAVAAKGKKCSLFIQNAATIGPIGQLKSVNHQQWEEAMNLNVNSQLYLLQAVLPQLEDNARVLHISSGAAHNAVSGWGSYCVTKAAFNMMWRILKEELGPNSTTSSSSSSSSSSNIDTPTKQTIYFGSVRPGIIDSDMQTAIRKGDDAAFPAKARFVSLYEKRVSMLGAGAATGGEGGERGETGGISLQKVVAKEPPTECLDSAENVSIFLRWLLLDASNDEFSKDEWDIREKSHHARWVGIEL